jgi:UDP-N-acetylglucosamine:LPS N-acetylglucosamine transferase
MNFPAFMYHAQHGAQQFDNAEQFATAGNGWVDTPAKLAVETKTYADGTKATGTPPLPDLSPDEQEQQAPLDREALKAKAKELGIEFAKNISTEKLAELVAAA